MVCPHCERGDYCGRENFASRPLRTHPSSSEVYAAVLAMYSRDPDTVLTTESWLLALDLEYHGFLGRLPLTEDVEHAQNLLIRSVETPEE